MNGWVLAATTFFASSVEFVEAATIVLAVGYAQGWRSAFTGACAAALALAAIVAVCGPLLANAGSLARMQLIVGPFLMLFGIAWLRKAVWRYSGRKSLRDESAIYDRELARLRADRQHRLGVAAAFQGVFVEGLEVAVIVVTFGAAGARALAWSTGGAAVAFAAVTVAAAALHKPFARVPENALKALVGVMLLALGTFWSGEALGIVWWSGDATLFVLAVAFALTACAVVLVQRRGVRA
ncbi:MAG TPA: hypothetical protein VJP76_02825 [Candidatus Tumulicola sp.]|nr:hypothetical protein [Candidatus Tumulicola sp.]